MVGRLSWARIQVKVFIAAFAFALVIGFLSNLPGFLIYLGVNWAIGTSIFITIPRFIVNPLLLFVYFYFTGRRIGRLKDFYSTVFSFFLGTWIGLVIVSILTHVGFQLSSSMPFVWQIAVFLGYFVTSLLSHSFFVGLSALAFGYAIKKNQ